ncbi:MAG: membrane-associated protease RseP (regulator of RpoE activity) [Acidimicrobiales bacterium]
MGLTAPAVPLASSASSKHITATNVSGLWATITLASLVAMAAWARDGLWLIAFLGVIILVHEGGHWFFARRAGMRPTEFYWGFGPEIVGFDYDGCRYGVKAIFLGGYVKLWGMTPTSELPEGIAESDTYRAATHRGRLATILAGPFTNFVTAAFAFGVANLLDGGGIFISFTQGFVDVWHVMEGTGQALWLWISSLDAYFGVVFDTSADPNSGPVRFLSPVQQAEVSGYAVANGATMALRWFAILSAAVGMVNLLPLPPLDGAHAAVTFVEGVTQRLKRDDSVRVDVRRLEPLAYMTIGALVVLSLGALVLDLRDLGISF